MRVGRRVSAPAPILGATERGSIVDQIALIVALVGILALLVGIVRYEVSPLDEAIKQAQEWDSSQKKMKQALERR